MNQRESAGGAGAHLRLYRGDSGLDSLEVARLLPPTELRGYFDENGRLLQWPARGRAEKRRVALEWLAAHFSAERVYREVEVNQILNCLHAFTDHAFLRRELVDRGYFRRNPDGSEYRRTVPGEASQ